MAGLNNVECAFVERIDKSMLLGNSSMFRKDNTLYEMSYKVGFYVLCEIQIFIDMKG